jgi:hypothetical protein
MRRTGIPSSARTILLGLASFALMGSVSAFLWWVQPIAAGAVGFVVVFGSAPMILRSTGLRQAGSIGFVFGYFIGSVVYLLLSNLDVA